MPTINGKIHIDYETAAIFRHLTAGQIMNIKGLIDIATGETEGKTISRGEAIEAIKRDIEAIKKIVLFIMDKAETGQPFLDGEVIN
jgi:hypothetical protein